MNTEQTPAHAIRPLNFAQKFSLFSEQWAPKVIAEMNDYQFKIARLQGDFIWHAHGATDETFIVLEGRLRIDFRDSHVLVSQGEMVVVPKGVEHKPSAEEEVKLLLIEPRGVLNTGEEEISDRTAVNDVWIYDYYYESANYDHSFKTGSKGAIITVLGWDGPNKRNDPNNR